MSNNLPKIPVRFLTENNELLKSQEALSGGQAGKGTDWEKANTENTRYEGALPFGVVDNYRAPAGRESGNQVFRRNPDGSLDLDAAKDVVVDIIHKVKDKGNLTELEKTILGVVFPTMFTFVDSRLLKPLMTTQLRLASWEVELISQKVAMHLQEEMQWNAGRGGFPTPHRRF